jgi:hypothetical protein
MDTEGKKEGVVVKSVWNKELKVVKGDYEYRVMVGYFQVYIYITRWTRHDGWL